MQTLGLSGESHRSDGRLKSIFWLTVENAWDVNYLGQQGFWICIAVAFFQLIASLFSGNPLLICLGIAAALTYVLGGMGVREASWPAAAMVFGLFFVDLLYTIASGRLPGILAIIAAGILLSNVRAAFLSSEWKPAAEDEDRPTRFNETATDMFVDQIPAKIWPSAQVYFFTVASAILLLELIGLVAALWHRLSVLSVAMTP